jgi:alkylhydroperoxidase/carboxymuconolactone decarboxylase family protein YurZ
MFAFRRCTFTRRTRRERGTGVAIAVLLLLGSAHDAIGDSAEKTGESLADRGRAMQARVYADMPADDPWLQMGQEHLFGQIWTRPGLAVRDRRLVSLSVAAALGSPPGYSSHLRGALESGDLSEEELWEWLLHFTQYAGYPKAAPVWSEFRRLLAERGSMPLPAMGVEPLPSSEVHEPPRGVKP